MVLYLFTMTGFSSYKVDSPIATTKWPTSILGFFFIVAPKAVTFLRRFSFAKKMLLLEVKSLMTTVVPEEKSTSPKKNRF